MFKKILKIGCLFWFVIISLAVVYTAYVYATI